MFNLNNLKNDWCSFRKIVIHLRYPRVFATFWSLYKCRAEWTETPWIAKMINIKNSMNTIVLVLLQMTDEPKNIAVKITCNKQ